MPHFPAVNVKCRILYVARLSLVAIHTLVLDSTTSAVGCRAANAVVAAAVVGKCTAVVGPSGSPLFTGPSVANPFAPGSPVTDGEA